MIRKCVQWLWIPAIVLLAFGLRTSGIDWDKGTYLHPDERFMGMVTEKLEIPESFSAWLDTDSSSFNPHNQGFSSYVYGTLPLLVLKTANLTMGDEGLTDILLRGRLIMAIFSSGTVLVLMLTALAFGSRRFAAAAGILMACSPFAIQQAHFFTVDSIGTFFSACTIACTLLALKRNLRIAPLGAMLCLSLAMACRLNLGLLLPWCGIAALIQFWPGKRWSILISWTLSGLLACVILRILQPYAFSATGLIPVGMNPEWIQDMNEVHALSVGSYEVPFAMQWVGRIPYLYALYNAVVWGLSAPVGLLATAGWLTLMVQCLTGKRAPLHLLVGLWPLIIFAYHGRIFLHTMRYFLPAYPWMILAGLLLLQGIRNRQLRHAAGGIILLLSLASAVGFLNIYKLPHNRLAASAWIFEHLPPGGTILGEHWDDHLPVHLSDTDNRWHKQYRVLEFEGYHHDSPEKLETLIDRLQQSDLVVLSSRRLAESIPRMPLRFPMTTRYYALLENGTLGWDLAAEFAVQPELLGFKWNTRNAEEAFRVYDHPVVRIYTKNEEWNLSRARQLLSDGIEFERIPDQRYLEQAGWNKGFLTAEQVKNRQTERSYNERFSPRSAGAQHPVAVWCFVLFIIGLINYPLQRRIFTGLQDSGWFLSRLIALLAITIPAWWLSSLEWVAFPRAVTLGACLLLAVNAMIFALRYEETGIALRRSWRRLLGVEGLFWTVFFGFLILRMRTPELWHPWAGGEKPMDLAFLQATALTDWFPAQSPWLSGAFINYYSFGFVLVTSLIHLTGVPPTLAYNLALPTFAAFAAAGAFSLSSTIFLWFRSRSGATFWWAAGIAGILVTLVCGNLGQLRYLIHEQGGHARDGYWNASRVLKVPEGSVEPITEFPFFSFLYGDLHAHVMTMPLAMLCLLLSIQLARKFSIHRCVLTAIPISFLYPANAWDFPLQLAIFVAAIFGPMIWRRPLAFRSRCLAFMLAVVALVCATAAFHHSYLAPQGGIELWNGPRSRMVDLMAAHAVQLIPLLAAVVILWINRRQLRRFPHWPRFLVPLLVGGCLVLIGMVEVIRLKDDIERMNTVFKFYYQVWWILSAIAAGLMIAAIQHLRRTPELIALVVIGTLPVIGGFLYPITATPARFADRFWTYQGLQLDGTRFMETDTVWYREDPLPLAPDRRGIDYLREHSSISDVILEGSCDLYSWSNRFSIYSGNPTVLGWDWHMTQQRPAPGDREVEFRKWDVHRMYTTEHADVREQLLRRYNVRFVICGRLETIQYGVDTQAKLFASPFLDCVHDEDGLRIYRVTE